MPTKCHASFGKASNIHSNSLWSCSSWSAWGKDPITKNVSVSGKLKALLKPQNVAKDSKVERRVWCNLTHELCVATWQLGAFPTNSTCCSLLSLTQLYALHLGEETDCAWSISLIGMPLEPFWCQFKPVNFPSLSNTVCAVAPKSPTFQSYLVSQVVEIAKNDPAQIGFNPSLASHIGTTPTLEQFCQILWRPSQNV